MALLKFLSLLKKSKLAKFFGGRGCRSTLPTPLWSLLFQLYFHIIGQFEFICFSVTFCSLKKSSHREEIYGSCYEILPLYCGGHHFWNCKRYERKVEKRLYVSSFENDFVISLTNAARKQREYCMYSRLYRTIVWFSLFFSFSIQFLQPAAKCTTMKWQ